MARFPSGGFDAGSEVERAAMKAEWERRGNRAPFEGLQVWTAAYQDLLRAVRGQPVLTVTSR